MIRQGAAGPPEGPVPAAAAAAAPARTSRAEVLPVGHSRPGRAGQEAAGLEAGGQTGSGQTGGGPSTYRPIASGEWRPVEAVAKKGRAGVHACDPVKT